MSISKSRKSSLSEKKVLSQYLGYPFPCRLARLAQRKSVFITAKAHKVHSIFYGNGIYLAKERIYQRHEIKLEPSRFAHIPFGAKSAKTRHR